MSHNYSADYDNANIDFIADSTIDHSLDKPVFRTRQAPSPTGFLHIGTARTVLFTKLIATINSGTWYLRLEDTDRGRLQPESVKILLGAMDSIGLSPDEGIRLIKNEELKMKNNTSYATDNVILSEAKDPHTIQDEVQNKNLDTQPSTYNEFYDIEQSGDYGPYIQSERLPHYHRVAQELIDKRLAYWSYLTADEKKELQDLKQINKVAIDYFSVILEHQYHHLMFQSVEDGLSDDLKPVLMYKLQRNSKVSCDDLLLGKSEFDLSLEEDFAILKSDGFPTYHLAHLVDDWEMDTTIVIRSQEWFPSYPKHNTMFMDYYGETLDYIHLPFILGEKGNKKMSKRDGNVNLQDYLDKGFLPEAIANYLAFLGWNPGTEQELYLSQESF
jgi:nondiscriminating glutamyl-tRNA synthetase